MKTIIMIIAWALFYMNIHAQTNETPSRDKSEKSLGFRAGLQNRHLLDEQKSALIYSSAELAAAIFFQRDARRSFLNISISASKGRFSADDFHNRWLYSSVYDIHGIPKTDSVLVMSQLISTDFQFTWLLKLNSGKINWMAGTTISEMLVYTDNNIGLFNSLGMSVTTRATAKIGRKSQVLAGLSLPVLSLTTRLPWHNTATSPDESELKVFFKDGSHLTGPAKFRMMKLDVQYDLRIAKRISLGAAYSFCYMHLTYFQPLKAYTNTFQLQTIYKL